VHHPAPLFTDVCVLPHVPDEIEKLDPRQIVRSCRDPMRSPPIPDYVASESEEVLLFVARPGDEAMFGGGTIQRLLGERRRVDVVLMTHGEGGPLLERSDAGDLVERRDATPAEVAVVRDAEETAASGWLFIGQINPISYLYPAKQLVDFGFTHSCEEAMERWEGTLPDGLRGALVKMVSEVRVRQPRIVATFDVHDDPLGSGDGQHRAVGALVELAVRFAASAEFAPSMGRPHTVEEVVTFAPRDRRADVTIKVDPYPRRRALEAFASQLRPENLEALASRREEMFVVRWRAKGAPERRGGALLYEWVRLRSP
jgi:LmbE family N-acetylglucosaminyl deacetylase